MRKPSLKEFDITATQYAKYQDYKSKIEERRRRREAFDYRFYEAIIYSIAIILLLLLLTIARDVLFNIISRMLSVGKFWNAYLFVLALLLLFILLLFVVKMVIAKPLRPILQPLKIHRPFKKLYINLQRTIPREAYFDNAEKYELKNEAYYNYISGLQQRFPDIAEFDYNLQNYFKNIIDEIVSYEHTEINKSIINQQLEMRRAVWLKMNGVTFEREVANIYIAHQHEAKTTKAIGGEGGVDIRLWKDGLYSIVQCKNVRRAIDEPAVRKLFDTMHKEKASKAILICSGGFTHMARNFAKNRPIQLLDLNQFLNLVNDIYPQEYQLVETISEASVSSSNTTYRFKVIGKIDILYSLHSDSEKTSYCLFETREEAKKVIRRLHRIDDMPPTFAAVYDVEAWWLESVPADYYRKALYYIKVREKEIKTTADKKEDKKYVQKELWDGEEFTQKGIWNGE
ncbi:MAG: restriction endonuclease [Bacteroidales bacterium]|nr:restriction endonuclease [Bacteroidales bacterium]